MSAEGSPTVEQIKNHILFKLHWKKFWGGKHTAIESVKKGIPAHLSGRYVDMTRELIKDGLILSKPTSYGLQISLNPNKREEIIKRAESFAKI
ncbi:MAG: hypothetical protein J4428_03055 [Candidatus Aenigmarchaeota archaeon]|nr:hypothetical protein [Candidatus Aenigmarchaeota archaeon]